MNDVRPIGFGREAAPAGKAEGPAGRIVLSADGGLEISEAEACHNTVVFGTTGSGKIS
jgi:hypothetical protein